MDPLKYKRRETKTIRQTPKTAFGNPQLSVPKVAVRRPQNNRNNYGKIDPGNLIRSRNAAVAPVAAPAVRLPQPSPRRAVPMLPALAIAATVTATATTPSAIRLARHTPIDMDLPGEDSPLRLASLKARSRRQRIRRTAFRSLAAAMVLVITLGGLLFSQSYLKLHRVFNGTTGTAAALKENVNPDLLKGEGSGRVNILLMGRGGGTHDAPDLTDTMMLASVDPVNHTTTLISLPRDLWVNIPQKGVMKLNAAWETGEFDYLGKQAAGSTDPKAIQAGFTMVDQAVEGILGVDVNYNMLMNFQAFKQAVDAVNGIDINVPDALVDPTMAWENGNNPVLAPAGVQTFDGAKALRYVRSRETSSDFARAQRQRAVITALKAKVVTLGTLSNPVKISQLISSFGDNVQTDLSLSNAQRLYKLTKNIGEAQTASVGLGDATNQLVTTGNINGQSVVLPKTGLFNYDAIQQYVRLQLKDPYIQKENAKVAVLNGTQIPNLATAKANELKEYGYNISGSGNAPANDWTRTTLVDLSQGKDKYTKHYLEQRLGVTATSTLPANVQANGAKFVIIIGTDEATPTQSQAN